MRGCAALHRTSCSTNSVASVNKTTAKEAAPELWGGLECTVVRIGDAYRSQFEETGHDARDHDLARVAALGVKRLRYPVLWETVSGDDPDWCEWDRADERMNRLRELGVAPIVGLMHHGSGPRYTNLLDPQMPEKLAVHARRVARRYPWVDMFTPVNEPLTTARFSALYGHWHPHARSHRAFLLALVHQCRAVAHAMRAIREESPGARLMQTEDLGKVFSTPRLRYQRDYENHRRWLTFDLLCGRVDDRHPLWRELLDNGVPAPLLDEFLTAPCPPDILGVNYYATSERHLDERRDLYPAFSWGGNAFETYADVEAARVRLPEADLGPEARLREAWERYRIPLAVAEAHLGGTRDEQLRWLKHVWSAAASLRAEGVDLRAVTIWSLFGATDWNSLLTQRAGFYEPGAFDIRSTDAEPRRTALARAAASLAVTGDFDHPALDGPGWWRREDRYYGAPPAPRPLSATARRVLIVGDGRLGHAFSAACETRSLACVMLGREALEPSDPASVEAALAEHRPWAVLNCAGYSGSLAADREPERVYRENVVGAVVLAEACGRLSLPYAMISSDRVFDGAQREPYCESHPVRPLDIFGRTKAEAERSILRASGDALIVRTGPLFGVGPLGMVLGSLREIVRVAGLAAEGELVLSPTYIPDLVHAVLDLIIDEAGGLWHLASEGSITAREFIERMRWPHPAAEGGGRTSLSLALASERATLMPGLASAFRRFEASGG